MECEYANWSPDCKTKDIYVLDGSSTDTWVLTEGTTVDTTDKELVEKVKKCLLTESRVKEVRFKRLINEETFAVMLITMGIILIIGFCCMCLSAEILFKRKPGIKHWLLDRIQQYEPPEEDPVGSDEEEAPPEYQTGTEQPLRIVEGEGEANENEETQNLTK